MLTANTCLTAHFLVMQSFYIVVIDCMKNKKKQETPEKRGLDEAVSRCPSTLVLVVPVPAPCY